MKYFDKIFIQIQNINFSYNQLRVINDINLSIVAGQNIAIIGESGCGKSTLLKLIYGLYDLDSGHIYFNDAELFGPKFNIIPGHSMMKYLSQDFDLMPYISVAENVGKYLSNTNSEYKNQRINELLHIVEMSDFAHTKPMHLSGGQKQRVAIAQVLAHEPKILLLDEPFSHIDNFRKSALRRNLFAYLKNQNIACIVATHDSDDVLSFADEVVVMKNGEVVQTGNSFEIYQNPVNKYVGSLFGEINEIQKSAFDSSSHHDETILCYPHQLQKCDDGFFKVSIRKSYFRGSHFLIKAVHQKNIIFFNHSTELSFNEIAFLNFIK